MDEAITLGLSAFGLGVLHAFEPGHGKTLIAAALVNSKRVWLDPIVLALSTALGHMAGVLLFTAISFLVVHEFVAPDFKFYLEVAIGTAMFGIGGFLLNRNLKRISHNQSCSCCSVTTKISSSKHYGTKHISVVGLLAGLVPCPSALALAGSTTMLGSLPQAISVALIFGIGVASSLLLIGITVTNLMKRVNLIPGISKLSKFSRFIAPLSLVVLGIMILVHAGSYHHH